MVVLRLRFVMMNNFVIILTCIFAKGFAGFIFHGPETQTVLVGHDALVYCDVTSSDDQSSHPSTAHGPYNVTWTFIPLDSSQSQVVLFLRKYRNNSLEQVSPRPEKYVNTQGLQLKLKAVQFSDAGEYTCSLSGSGGSKTASVIVLENVLCGNVKRVVQEGRDAIFNCSVKYVGSIAPNISWERRSDEDNLGGHQEIQRREDLLVSTYKITSNYLMNGHIYTCKVEFPTIPALYTCQTGPALDVLFQVRLSQVTRNPDHLNGYTKGENIYLYCAASGNPAPHYQWYHTPDEHAASTVLLSSIPRYKINHLNKIKSGTYKCMVWNSINGTEHKEEMKVVIKLRDVPTTVTHVFNGIAHKTILSSARTNSSFVSVNSSVISDATQSLPENGPISPYAVGAIISSCLAVLFIAVFVFVAMRLRTREKILRDKLARDHDETLDDQEVELLDENIQPKYQEAPVVYSDIRQNWEMPRKDVRLLEKACKGEYVEIWKGRMRTAPGREEIIRVAIKKFCSDATDKERKFFLAEMEVMKVLQTHNNVIRLLGCYTSGEPPMMMLDLATEGTLWQYIQKRKPGQQEVEIAPGNNQAVRLHNHCLTAHKMLALAAQIASGLAHLSKFRLIYYRLQTQNVLVSKGGVCKLSGFGFPHNVAERSMCYAQSAPVRWMSPESLSNNEFNLSTDVWSYGILLWEILHFGMVPYTSMETHEVMDRVQSGYCMPQPPHCSSELYNVMFSCWSKDQKSRPAYSDILLTLRELVPTSNQHINIDKLSLAVENLDAV